MNELLLVEDDPVLGRGLSIRLETEGYVVSWVTDLASAKLAHFSKKFDLILLDQNLPDGNGLTLLKEIRASKSRIPIVILTAKSDEESVVQGLNSGANDYVKKPFGSRELIARIKVALKEITHQNSVLLSYYDLSLSTEKRKVTYLEKPIELNRREFDLLAYFVSHAEAVVTRDSLIFALDRESEIFDRTIDSHISHLRAKLKKSGISSLNISSVYGIGYRLEKK